MPMPLSRTVSVFASLSYSMSMCRSPSPSSNSGLPMASKRSLSQASEALETSSRRKISLCEYSECVTRRKTCATSASKGRVSVVLFMAIDSSRKTRQGHAPPFGARGKLHDWWRSGAFSSRGAAHADDPAIQDDHQRREHHAADDDRGRR